MKHAFDIVATSVVMVCAVAVLAMHAQRSMIWGTTQPQLSSPSVVPDWREESELGIWIGPADANTIITTFIDFTCPHCQRLAPVLDSVRLIHGDSVAMVVHHFPLGRPLSTPAAIAAECAHEQGHFTSMAEALYGYLGSADNGEPAWDSVAERAGIPDLEDFRECIELPEERFPRILAGREVGRRTGVRGTPTVWVNGIPTAARDVPGFESLLANK